MAAIKDDSIRVREWEAGLPSSADLTPLSHSLISRVLARAFCIPPSTVSPTSEDVLQASQSTLQLLRQKQSPSFALPSFDQYSSYEAANARSFRLEEGTDEDRGGGYDPSRRNRDEDAGQRTNDRVNKLGPMLGKGGAWDNDRNGQERDGGGGIGGIGNGNGNSGGPEHGQAFYWPAQGAMPPVGGTYGPMGSDQGRYGGLETGSESTKGASLDKPRKIADTESEDVDSADGPDGNAARTLKRPRLVWTPQLHKRFVDAVGHLGIKNAVPKTIMQLMNVEGLTRENVASHLQKYRLYLKRMQGLSTEGPSASDPLFASAPLPPSLTSPHFFGGHHHSRPDNGASGGGAFSPPAALMPRAQGSLPPGVMGPGPLGLGGHHFGGFEHHPFNIGLSRTAPQRPSNVPDHREHLVNPHSSQAGPGSPPHRVLTLFPPSGH